MMMRSFHSKEGADAESIIPDEETQNQRGL